MLALGFAAPAAAAVLISNIDQTVKSGQSPLSNFDLGQGFTTGSNGGGYTLTSVEVKFQSAPSSLTVKIVTNALGTPTDVATLTNPSTLAAGNLTFTAPNNTTLSASTTYYVILEGSGNLNNTGSNLEDDGGMAGWSIADKGLFRTASSTGAFSEENNIRLIRINGTVGSATSPTPTPGDTTAPTLSTMMVSGTMLTLRYDEALDPDSVPDAADFTVKVDGSAVSLSDSSPVAVSGTTVALTLAEVVTPGQTVTVSYTKGTNPIRDVAGNDAAGFTDRAVTGSQVRREATLEHTLAALGRQLLTSAVDGIDARFADAGPDSVPEATQAGLQLDSLSTAASSGLEPHMDRLRFPQGGK